MRLSHEAIYQPLSIQRRAALKRELTACLRTGRALRLPRCRLSGRGKSFVTSESMIGERPADLADRGVPGPCEGDLLLGLASSASGTLVERITRFTLLLHLPPTPAHLRSWERRKCKEFSGARGPWRAEPAVHWSRGHGTAGSGRVVFTGLPRPVPPRAAPCRPMPASSISASKRSTVQRATSISSRLNCRQTFRAPSTSKFCAETRWI